MEEFFKPKEKNAYASLPFITRPEEIETFISFASDSEAFEVFLHRNVQETIRREARDAAPNETIGLLAGRVVRDERGPYTLVLAAAGARANEVEATPSHVRISATGHAQVRTRLETSAYGLDIIGWYHSHPRFPPRFSPVDITEQSTWRDPNHVGIVISGIDKEQPLGVYRGPHATLLIPKSSLDYLIRPKRPSEPVTIRGQAPVVPRTAVELSAVTPEAPALVSESTQNSNPSEVTTPRASKMAAFIYFALGLGLLGMAFEVVWFDHRLSKMEERLTNFRPGREQAITAPPRPSPSLVSEAPLNSSSEQDVSSTKPETGAKPLAVQPQPKVPKRRLVRRKKITASDKSTPVEKQNE